MDPQSMHTPECHTPYLVMSYCLLLDSTAVYHSVYYYVLFFVDIFISSLPLHFCLPPINIHSGNPDQPLGDIHSSLALFPPQHPRISRCVPCPALPCRTLPCIEETAETANPSSLLDCHRIAPSLLLSASSITMTINIIFPCNTFRHTC